MMIMIVMVISFALIIFLLVLFFNSYDCFFSSSGHNHSKQNFPKSYPLIGCTFSLIKNRHRVILWTTELLQKSATSTITLTGLLGKTCIMTSNPFNVQHILKTRFHSYQKDAILSSSFHDLFGDGIFLVDGTKWKSQRQLMRHELKDDIFHHLVENVTLKELSSRLLPIFDDPDHVLDLQEIIGRFTFDMVCQVAFGYDPKYLLPSLPNTSLANAYRTAIKISMGRCISPPLLWKAKKHLNIGSEKNMSLAINELREFIRKIIREKKDHVVLINHDDPCSYRGDFIDRMLARVPKNYMYVFDNNDEKFYIDETINFILGAEDTLSSALTWFFWLVSSNPLVEKKILKEIVTEKDNNWRGMVYMHAAICESMRLYPPIPQESKQAMEDDIWPDGTKVKKGTHVLYNIYAMGRSKELWGTNCTDFNPERWLERDPTTGDWRFIPRDPFIYPVFQAGPRTCIGREIAFMQIKLVAAFVLRRFRLVPAEEGYRPAYASCMISKMSNGFPVRVLRRNQ